jgi:hypothetical protein
VFAPELSRHEKGHCSAMNHGAANRTPFLPLPHTTGIPTSEADWT